MTKDPEEHVLLGSEEPSVSSSSPAEGGTSAPESSWWKLPRRAEQDPEKFGKVKSKFQILSRRNARSAATSMQALMTRKVYVSEDRVKALHDIDSAAEAKSGGASTEESKSDPPKKYQMLLLNFEPKQVTSMKGELQDTCDIRSVKLIPDDWVSLLGTTRDKFKVLPGVEEGRDPLDTGKEDTGGDGVPGSDTEGQQGTDVKEEDTRLDPKEGCPHQVAVVRISELVPRKDDNEGLEVPEFQRCMIAVQFMASRIVIPFVDCKSEQQAKAIELVNEFMKDTWPVQSMLDGVIKCCRGGKGKDVNMATDDVNRDVHRILALREMVRDDVFTKIEKWGHVNYVWHGLKRIPVAFVPFGVSAMNALGLSKLVAKILIATGMIKDAETKKSSLSLASQAYAKVFVLDSAGDVYQMVAGGTVAVGLVSEIAMGAGIIEAVSALSVADFALLGSVSLVTGAVAAIGAAISRPDMVSSLANLIATLQTLWLIFPNTRREEVDGVDHELAVKGAEG